MVSKAGLIRGFVLAGFFSRELWVRTVGEARRSQCFAGSQAMHEPRPIKMESKGVKAALVPPPRPRFYFGRAVRRFSDKERCEEANGSAVVGERENSQESWESGHAFQELRRALIFGNASANRTDNQPIN